MEAKPNMINKFNKPFIGFAAGMILPLIGFLIYYAYNTGINPDLSFMDYLDTLYDTKAFTPVISICVLPNLLLYFIFKKLDYWYSIKGIILSLIIYVLIVVVLKFA